ncbi:MAG: hypothetical protein KGZ80_09075 [Methylomonas sp.]|nr:hypothetical protein [Methylomonas sp.]
MESNRHGGSVVFQTTLVLMQVNDDALCGTNGGICPAGCGISARMPCVRVGIVTMPIK